MTALPLIVGFGGINAAGRSSFHHAYRRMILDTLNPGQADRTYRSLATLMQVGDGSALTREQRQYILDHSLIRRIEPDWFDVDRVAWNKSLLLKADASGMSSFIIKEKQLPERMPDNWRVARLGDGNVRIEIEGDGEFLVPLQRSAAVQAAGQLPTGFKPGSLYPSRNHPRALEMTVYAASDALGSLGIDWDAVRACVAPDAISVYAGCALGQLDADGFGGMLSARFNSKRATAKQCPFGLPDMVADFICAYVLGSVGSLGAYVGACATFLYNLKQGIADIRSGKARVAVIASSEAPITPDVMDGFAAMGALACDDDLLALDLASGRETPDYRRASRPFSTNCGFTIGESAQCVVLMDDALALELGATVYGAATDVFVNADGFKKSISSPGVGNYLTVARALAAARTLLGEASVRERSFVHAHGTSTPQNRVSESHILNEVAKAFGIESWPVAAIKAYLGHSLGAAAGDQVANTLGVWSQGVIPGIATIDHVAPDVHQSHLRIGREPIEVGVEGMDSAIINAKGFGGNNASGVLLAPHVVTRMLAKRYGREQMNAYARRNEAVRERAEAYDEATLRGETAPVYKFDYQVLGGADVQISAESITVPGYGRAVELSEPSPYTDLI